MNPRAPKNAEEFDFAPLQEFGGANAYLRFRAARLSPHALAEKSSQAPHEALLQQAWLHQRLVRERLQTTDGRAVKILHPGFWNREPGPDFRQAVIQIGNEKPVSGDVEIDIVPGGWQQHAHAGNPAYRNVILHVTWEPASGSGAMPSLCLKHALDSTLPELSFWLGIEPKPRPESLAGECSAPLRALDPQVVRDIVKQAGQARLRAKAEQILARARQVGWTGALWEGLFSALGYKKNVWPMRRIAELLPLLATDVARASEPALALQSRFFGASGLLPADTRLPKDAAEYLRRIWDLWWRDADFIRDQALPVAVWDFAGIRPVNHPQRRLALGAHWVSRAVLPRQIEAWMERTIPADELLNSLEELLQVKHDPFWSYRCTLRAAPQKGPQPLLGAQRVTDLAVNVILPWLFVRACVGKSQALANAVEARYFLWPAGEDNSALRLARQRLFGGVSARFHKTAAEQQGLLQITRDFCDHSNAVCENCPFPDLLRTSSRN